MMESITAEQLKSNDVILWQGERWTILSYTPCMMTPSVSVDCIIRDQSGRQTVMCWFKAEQLTRISSIKRNCAPCFDSDCDCIYEGIG